MLALLSAPTWKLDMGMNGYGGGPMPMAAQVPCSRRALPAELGEENSLASSFHLLPLLVYVTAQSQVTQLGSQAEGGTAWACQAFSPHLDFPARGQWKPVSHLKEVLSPKQEVALQTETPCRISPGPWDKWPG